MSQIFTKASGGGGIGTVVQFTTDSGTVLPDGAGNVNFLGGANISSSGAGDTATYVLSGTTDHAVQIGNAAGALTSLGVGATNTVLLGSTGADPSFGAVPNAALANSSMTFTSGANITFTGSPVSLGGAGTIAVSGTTDHGVQVGNATGSLTSVAVGASNTALLGSTGADPSFGTIPNAILDNSDITLNNGTNITITGSPISLGGSGTVALSGMINRALHVGNPSGGLTSLGVAANGQIPIGSGGLDPVLATITGGSNLNVVNGGGSITVNLDNSVSVSGSMTAGTGLTATTGDVAVGAGNITSAQTDATGNVGIIKIGPANRIHFWLNDVMIGGNAGSLTSSGIFNVGIGQGGVLSALTTGAQNVGIGNASLGKCTTGSNNVSLGYVSAFELLTGSRNVMVGDSTGQNLTSASDNTVLGNASFANLITGSFNVGMGRNSGAAYTGAESSNLLLGSQGVIAESNVMRLGTHGGAAEQQNKCFIAGVRGITTGVADAIAVLIDSAFQLGTASSSIRVKKNVEDMGNTTGNIFQLRPVNFDYIESPSERRQYGLIAEEVEKVMPDLVVYDKQQLPETVRYHELPVMLLNEMKKLLDRIEKLESNCTCKGCD